MAAAKKSKTPKSAGKPDGKSGSKGSTQSANKANGRPNGAIGSAAAPTRAKATAALRENEAQIAVHWKEEEYFRPSAKFIAQANLTDPADVECFSEKNFPECFREYAQLLYWDQYWHTTLDTSN